MQVVITSEVTLIGNQFQNTLVATEMAVYCIYIYLYIHICVCRQTNCGHTYRYLVIYLGSLLCSLQQTTLYLYGFEYELSVFHCLQTSVHSMGKSSLFLLCESTWGGDRQEWKLQHSCERSEIWTILTVFTLITFISVTYFILAHQAEILRN